LSAFRLFLLFIGLEGCATLSSQEIVQYPRWFLEGERVVCPNKIVGYTTRSHYQHNAVIAAKKNAAENGARFLQYSLAGIQAFTKFDRGTRAEGNTFQEHFDNNIIEEIFSNSVLLDSFFTPNCTIILLGDSSCTLPNTQREMLSLVSEPVPQWIITLPRSEEYFYSVGVEQQNYYEYSCWLEAEKAARLELARTISSSKIKAVQQMSNTTNAEYQSEELSVTVRNAEIAGRWRDTKNNIYYVLMRCSRNQ